MHVPDRAVRGLIDPFLGTTLINDFNALRFLNFFPRLIRIIELIAEFYANDIYY